MKKISKRLIFTLVSTIVLSTLMFLLFEYYRDNQVSKMTLSLDIESNSSDEYQVYYDISGDMNWSEEKSAKNSYTKLGKTDDLKFVIPSDSKNIRIDFGHVKKTIDISNIFFKKNGKTNVDYNTLKNHIDDIKYVEFSDNGDFIEANITNSDSYIVLSDIQQIVNPILDRNVLIDIGLLILSLFIGFIMALAFSEVKNGLEFVKVSGKNIPLIKSLSVNDFKSKYASSYLGIIWGFIHPLITIVVYWFVFQVGFRSGDVGDVPYVLWFIAGIIPWFFFSEALPSATNSFLEYSYLVKKVVFKIEVLPTVKIVSSTFVHLFFVLFLFIVMIVYKRMPGLASLQFIYYSIAMIVLVFAVSIFTSSVILFFRDLGQIITIIVSVGFWATPIGWQLGMLPESIGLFFKFNPMYYIVNGYRDAFVNNIYFWQRPYATLYFWLFCIVVFLIGVKMYNKLKPHFSDVI